MTVLQTCHDAFDFEDIPPQEPTAASMSANERIEALLRIMEMLGYTVTEEPNWLNRDPGYIWYDGGPFGIMLHHTATDEYAPERAYPEPYGDRTDGKTICNILIQPDGVLNFVSSGPANYSSGLNWKGILDDYILQRRRFHGPQSGDLGPEWYGNRAFINIETVHPGLGEPIPEAQESSVVAVIAVMCAIMGWDSTCVIGHYDGRGTKPDPEWQGRYSNPPYSIAGVQDAVQAILDGSELPEPPPTPPEPEPDPEEYEMPTLHYMDGYFDGPHPEYRAAVKACQIMLAHHDFADAGTVDGTCAADGAYGHGTEASVEAFQAANNLTVDGVCGPKTWAALNEERD